MSIFAIIILITHYVLVFILCLYGVHRIYHGLAAKKIFKKVKEPALPKLGAAENYPHVTVQLPFPIQKSVLSKGDGHI